MRRLILWVVVLSLLNGCAPAGSTAGGTSQPPSAEPSTAGTGQAGLASGVYRFTTEDGVELSGTVYAPAAPASDLAVVLAHMRPADQSSWAAFARDLAAQGYTALTFDFRGYEKSGGEKDYGLLDRDTRAALAFLRDHGFSKLACIGASMGGTACAKAAHEPGVVGLGIISSPMKMDDPLVLTEADFKDLSYPKLFVASEDDKPYVDDVRQMAEWAPDPKQVQIYSGDAHGNVLFLGEHAQEFKTLLLDFVGTVAAR